MRCTSLVIAAFLVVKSTAFDSLLETKDFNITQALLDQGVDVLELPVSVGDSKRSGTGCAAACASLKILYGDAAVETREEKAFRDFTGSYWSSNQAEVNPYCIFIPQRPNHVSVTVLLARLAQCPFAAKSGGHAAFAGASSVEGGITISFANLKGVSLSKDKKIASIEPGNTWGPVYEQLAKSDVSVIGGRLYNIGVGGLTTGGGISFFSNIYGWACDNVESYEIVLANGIIVKASAKSYPHLYWALRGGGNNFGLVVKFNLKTILLPKSEMWGGSRVYTEDRFPDVTNALFNVLKNSENDPKAGIYVPWIYYQGNKLSMPTMYYAEPDAGNATIWKDFNKIEAVSDTTQNRVLAAWGKEIMNDSPPGLREVYYVITTKLDHGILEYTRDYFYKTVLTVANIPGIIPAFVVQGITTPQLKQMQKNGGNALGIDPEGGPLLILQLSVMWNNKSDDDAIYSWISDIFQVVTKEAKARGVNNDYVYMNYASQYQDVIASYGSGNKAKLKTIAKKYDPQQVFQQLQPGYFKLDRAPIPNSGYFSH
ncbi:FAD binding domain-containing protein [Fusarium mexicanum]|uniref:FAD binding domain-containing protein n=1 Tax=Fusarium mexicanum TaxID=751941 RepID=A0A8H5J3G2_9HYPO|nr:FAD binding domain-containing protein [Fusarium mexicanum]